MTELERKAKEFAIHWHCEVNKQMYGNERYSKHLEDVVGLVKKYLKANDALHTNSSTIVYSDRPTILAAAWLHDVVEDCEQVSLDDIEEEFGVYVAKFVGALTAPKGTRKEKVEKGYYRNLRDLPVPLFIKLCDRLANVRSAIVSGNTRLLKMYAKEHNELVRAASGACYSDARLILKDLNGLMGPYVERWAK